MKDLDVLDVNFGSARSCAPPHVSRGVKVHVLSILRKRGLPLPHRGDAVGQKNEKNLNAAD